MKDRVSREPSCPGLEKLTCATQSTSSPHPSSAADCVSTNVSWQVRWGSSDRGGSRPEYHISVSDSTRLYLGIDAVCMSWSWALHFCQASVSLEAQECPLLVDNKEGTPAACTRMACAVFVCRHLHCRKVLHHRMFCRQDNVCYMLKAGIHDPR